MKMNFGYIRASSDKQTVENQRFEIENFVKKTTFKSMGGLRKQ
jgi:DNA invertase Pin-like site-specific DNA recombinase